ncbi:uncharacterized protein (DUF1697 family) [Mumia flava]|uniref:Uncharacterized protein (DUF1697 family) n=1 Tax=Mumia flava TaxID=1348852 RepID=A0A0B2B6Y7_9ACTN|nr:DUF1697 domain-containing protein [Mumia flava]PJJ57849.1 uncharacterized protein (DUF1697 family) [Mumia flava]
MASSTPVVYLLRAVNVGGNKVPMAELRELASDLGADAVSSYVNSGNLLCVPPGDAAAFGTELEAGIADRMGVTTDAIARTGPQLRAALDAYPYDLEVPKLRHVWFLASAPDADAVRTLEAFDFAPEQVTVDGDLLHIRYEDGVARSKVTAPRLLKLTGGIPGTGRNLRTVETLAERLQAI